MTKRLQLIAVIVCFSISVCLTSTAHAASSSGQVSWSNSYQQFGLSNWKFGIDPFPFDNGQLFMEYDPDRAAPASILTEDLPGYTVLETLLLNGEMPAIRVRFERTAESPTINPSSGGVEIFNIFFDDLDQARTAADGHGPLFTLRGDLASGGGFDYPTLPNGQPDFNASPGTPVLPFSALAIPEPSSAILLLLGLAALLFQTRGCRKVS